MTRSDELLIARLRDEGEALQRASWSRPEGGIDGCIAAILAAEAADRIEALTRSNDEPTEAMIEAGETAWRAGDGPDTDMCPDVRAIYNAMRDAS